MTDLQKFQRVCRVFLARLLIVYGPAAPDLLRRLADELESLEQDRLDAEMQPADPATDHCRVASGVAKSCLLRIIAL